MEMEAKGMRGDDVQPVTSLEDCGGALERVSGAPVMRWMWEASSMEWERCR